MGVSCGPLIRFQAAGLRRGQEFVWVSAGDWLPQAIFLRAAGAVLMILAAAWGVWCMKNWTCLFSTIVLGGGLFVARGVPVVEWIQRIFLKIVQFCRNWKFWILGLRISNLCDFAKFYFRVKEILKFWIFIKFVRVIYIKNLNFCFKSKFFVLGSQGFSNFPNLPKFQISPKPPNVRQNKIFYHKFFVIDFRYYTDWKYGGSVEFAILPGDFVQFWSPSFLKC